MILLAFNELGKQQQHKYGIQFSSACSCLLSTKFHCHIYVTNVFARYLQLHHTQKNIVCSSKVVVHQSYSNSKLLSFLHGGLNTNSQTVIIINIFI